MRRTDNSIRDLLPDLCRFGFYLSVLLLFYGTLFPFHFDLSSQAISRAWSAANLLPFWDVRRGRIHSLPDMLGNGLLTVPLGLFAFLWFDRNRKLHRTARWFVLGFFLGLLSEIIQLGIPSRTSDITDALNNGFGALAGAVTAALFGRQILDFVSGSLMERRTTYFWMLAAIVATEMLLPLDLSLSVSHARSGLKSLWTNPWESGVPIRDEWIQMVECAILGALAATTARARLISFALAIPLILETAQLLVESHAPSLRDLTMNLVGVAVGIASGLYMPAIARPLTGFILMSSALVAQGLSPYRFAGRGARAHFEWIPLVEYYNQTTGSALYDALAGLLNYGLIAALLGLSCRRPRWAIILWAALLAGGVEAAQLFVPGRFAGTTDIVIAAIGAWAGYSICKATTHFNDFTKRKAGYQK